MDTNRLRWASRRGMLELDLILSPFLENVYPRLGSEQQKLFQRLLNCEDQDLFNWFLNKGEPEDESIREIVRVVRENTGLKANGH